MTAPIAPINLSPAAGADGSATLVEIAFSARAVPVTVGEGGALPPGGRPITYAGWAQDADRGDWVTGLQVQVFADSATNATPGTPIINVTRFADSMASGDRIPNPWTLDIGSAPLTPGTNYRWRVRSRDMTGVWGAWSSLLIARFKANTVPGPPVNLAVTPTTLDPTFFGTLNDPDAGATLDAVQVQVQEPTSLGTIVKWDSELDDSAGTRFEVEYGGTPLVFGTRYRWRARTRDNLGSVGAWSAWQSWRPADVTGPDAMEPIDVEERQTSLTPTLTIAHSAAFDAHELEVAEFADGSGLLWDVGVTTYASTSSKNVVYAGAPLAWGRTFYWRAKIRIAGTTWSDWSAWYPFYINAVPDAPDVSIEDAVDSGDYVTVTTDEPTILIPFSDPDVAKGYDDEATRQEVAIRGPLPATTAVSGSPFVDASSPAETFDVPAATLSFEEQYQVRARYDDDVPRRSVWSPWLTFKVSVAPVLSAPTTVDDTDPAPEVGWTFTSSPGKDQAALRVRVFDDTTGELIYDSGIVFSDDPSHVIPGEILQDGETYHWDVTAYDTDLLSDFLEGDPWTADFVTPDALTGLTAGPDEATSSVELEWDVTTLDADHFWRYYIYRLDPNTGDYIRIGEVDDRDDPTFVDTEAPHGASTYRVTVTNGWAESTPASVTTTLALRWWIVDPADDELRFEVEFVTGFRARRVHQQDAFEPLGRPEPVVVSGALLPPAGVMAIFVHYTYPELVGLLEEAARVDPYVLLKSPFGEIFRVKLGSIETDRGDAGSQTATVDYRVVAA